MPSLCAISDCHLGYRHRFKTSRLRDYVRAFTDAVSKALDRKPDAIVLGGDILNHPKPDPVSMRNLVEKLLYMADFCPIVVLIGNHEIQGHLSTTYTPLYGVLHENIHVLSTDNPKTTLNLAGCEANFWGMQFIRGQRQAEDELLCLSQNVDSGVNILCLHQAVEGYVTPHELSLRVLREVQHKFDLILLGHYHRHVKLEGLQTPAYYIGATERTSFNEAENKTGFLYFEDLKKPPIQVPTDSSSCRRIKAKTPLTDASQINAEIRKMIEENKGVSLLKIDVELGGEVDTLDLCEDFSEYEDHFKIVEVNIKTQLQDQEIRFEKINLSEELIYEYFEKTGEKNPQLIEAAVDLYNKYAYDD
ncbi:MAG: hypothetical protein GF334_12240 [Candidatus Altiarchaeales archaeon]|nr:hypothetical protein [Candidatus Altiarchaeales archaeon]